MSTDPLCILSIKWVRQGQAQVEDWWIEERGSATVPESSLEEYISFANYDLQRDRFPRINQGGSTLQVRGVRRSRIQEAGEILRYHGFEISSIEDH